MQGLRRFAVIFSGLLMVVACGGGGEDENDASQTCTSGIVEGCVLESGDPGERRCLGGEWTNCQSGSCEAGETRQCETACGTSGMETCQDGGEWGNICVAPEQCNGVDDDCDGDTDEGITQPCYCGTAVWVEVCSLGQWGDCSVGVPGEGEICDDLDNDCDGDVDEGCDLDNDDYCAVEMEIVGTPEVCPNGGNDCDDSAAVVNPQMAESCNLIDDNCNGEKDEGLGEETCGVGVCEHTIQRCQAGDIVSCDPMEGAKDEVCDQLDNDCDGKVDEDVPGCCEPGAMEECSKNEGICEKGVRECNPNGNWGACSGQEPVAELCDGLDNDCDGITDNGNPGGGVSCGTNIGECKTGVTSCTGDPEEYLCEGEIPWTLEVCDGKDNDCDGSTDEELDEDQWELPSNDTCGGARDLGNIQEVPYPDPEQMVPGLSVSASLYHENGAEDSDWYTLEAQENSDLLPCNYNPLVPEACYYMFVTLDPPEGANQTVCLYDFDCDGVDVAECFEASQPGGDVEVLYNWSGVYLLSDNIPWVVGVLEGDVTGQSCLNYSLKFEFYSVCPDDNDLCPWEDGYMQ